MSKTFSIGDIHGNYLGLMQCLERSKFDYEADTLISIGDLVDGHSQSFEVVEELLKMAHLIAIKGNHDEWFNVFIETGMHPDRWAQGGASTARSYLKSTGGNPDLVAKPDRYTGWVVALISSDVPFYHQHLFKTQELYYIDDKNRLFVHGGYNPRMAIEHTKRRYPHNFYWDRDLWNMAMSCKEGEKIDTVEKFEHIFIGHTSVTYHYKDDKPVTTGGVTNLDTGGGWEGRVTIMDVDTMEYWQSDRSVELYPEFKGR
jgi:serine/threonine protein phosphatase 1